METDKSALRRKFKDIRAGLASAERKSAADQLSRNLRRFLQDYPNAQHCLYQARPDEAPCDLTPVENYFYPVVHGEDLQFLRPTEGSAFRTGSFSLKEPVAEKSEILREDQPTVVCCPAVAVDSEGRRLGLGKGFYDRFFARNPSALRVGVVFHVQFANTPLPADSWDQELDWIVSEKMILRTSIRSSQSWT